MQCATIICDAQTLWICQMQIGCCLCESHNSVLEPTFGVLHTYEHPPHNKCTIAINTNALGFGRTHMWPCVRATVVRGRHSVGTCNNIVCHNVWQSDAMCDTNVWQQRATTTCAIVNYVINPWTNAMLWGGHAHNGHCLGHTPHTLGNCGRHCPRFWCGNDDITA